MVDVLQSGQLGAKTLCATIVLADDVADGDDATIATVPQLFLNLSHDNKSCGKKP